MDKAVIVPVQTTGTKEATELGVATKGLLISIKKALEDGKISVADVFDIVSDNWDELVTAVNGLKDLPAEAKEESMAMFRGIIVPISEGVEELLK